jgi:ADP-ribose pyrophosphatase YjhB (NUDIX family)
LRALSGIPETPPLSVKGVCLDEAGRVLVCRNWRRGWELPGGRPHLGEDLDACLAREVREETGVEVTVRDLVAGYPFEVLPGRWVDIVAYGCELSGGDPAPAPVCSGEHAQVAFRPVEQLGDELPAGYCEAVLAWRRLRA